jgi:phenylalanyl-tRNA synthetase beta chain
LTDFDVSLLVDSAVAWETIEAAVSEKIEADSLIRGVSFVGEYRGQQIPTDKKSVTLRLVVGSSSKTLTMEEIESSAHGVVEHLKESVGAEQRG